MKNLNILTSLQKKMALVALTGAITLPMLATSAQADPPKHAPAWGQRDKDGRPGNSHNNNKGWDNHGHDRDGRDRDGRDRDGRDRNGFDRNGYDRNGYDRNGRDRGGYDRSGYNSSGYNKTGFDRNGYDRNGRDRNGRYRPGFNGGRPNWGNPNPGNWNNGNFNNGTVTNNFSVSGTVIDSQNRVNTLRVRADNGRVYTVPTASAHYFYVGNRVRVNGRLSGGTIERASVSRL